MGRAAPSVDRVVAVFNFFASHPRQSFSLSNIVSSLKISRASCHGLLIALTEAGYLYRDRAKHYSLGPALCAIGEIAQDSFLPIVYIKDDIRRIADHLGVICSAYGLIRSDVVVLHRAVPAAMIGSPLAAPSRVRLSDTTGLPFTVWASKDAERDWIAGIRASTAPKEARAWISSLERMRELGFCVGGISPAGQPLAPPQLKKGEHYLVHYISAPLTDPNSNEVYIVALEGFNRPYSSEEILDLGRQVKQICQGGGLPSK